MALTDSQIADTRRFAGYSVTGTTLPVTDDQDIVYVKFGMTIMSLHKRLTTLTSTEELILVNTYLAACTTLEAAILAVSDNLDTQEAGPWKSNPREMAQRTALFNKYRRDMAGFLGVTPGPSLGSGGMSLVRG